MKSECDHEGDYHAMLTSISNYNQGLAVLETPKF